MTISLLAATGGGSTAALLGLAVFAAAGHAFLCAALVNRLHGLAGPRVLIKLLTALLAVALPAVPLAYAWAAWGNPAGASRLASPATPAGAYAWIAALAATAALPLQLIRQALRFDQSVQRDARSQPAFDLSPGERRQLFHGGWARTLGAIPGNQVLSPVIERRRLAIPRLPPELAGLTIVHLSDLHFTGRIGLPFYQRLFEAVNELRPDVAAITGDIVETEACWPWLAETLGQLCVPLGAYFVLGNHDRFVDQERTRKLLIEGGLISLSGRWVRAEWNGAAVELGGNELPWMPAAPALPPRSPQTADAFRLALCHTPDQLRWCVSNDVDLALAGHVHGGQAQAPWLGPLACPSLFGTKYACGVFRRAGTVLHVTRGISGATPLRINCAPEIALLELATDEPPPVAPPPHRPR